MGPCDVVGFIEIAGAELRALYVDPRFWGTGIATALHRRAAACTQLEVIAANARARRFYEREGWTLAGEAKPHDFDGTVVPFVRYAR